MAVWCTIFINFFLPSLIPPPLKVDEFDARAIVRDTNKEEAAQIFEAYRSYAPFCRTSLVNAILMWRSQQHSKKTEWSDFFTENSHPKLQGFFFFFFFFFVSLFDRYCY